MMVGERCIRSWHDVAFEFALSDLDVYIPVSRSIKYIFGALYAFATWQGACRSKPSIYCNRTTGKLY